MENIHSRTLTVAVLDGGHTYRLVLWHPLNLKGQTHMIVCCQYNTTSVCLTWARGHHCRWWRSEERWRGSEEQTPCTRPSPGWRRVDAGWWWPSSTCWRCSLSCCSAPWLWCDKVLCSAGRLLSEPHIQEQNQTLRIIVQATRKWNVLECLYFDKMIFIISFCVFERGKKQVYVTLTVQKTFCCDFSQNYTFFSTFVKVCETHLNSSLLYTIKPDAGFKRAVHFQTAFYAFIHSSSKTEFIFWHHAGLTSVYSYVMASIVENSLKNKFDNS